MFKALKQVRSAAGMLNPAAVGQRVNRPVNIGLVAADSSGYAEMEDFLVPAAVGHEERSALMERIFRPGDPGMPERFDLVMYHPSISCPRGAVEYQPEAPGRMTAQILELGEDLELALARQFPAFRKPVIDRVVRGVARENALFALATALPNIVPSLIELPWAIGEFASDTAFLTMNQVRMAFLIAGACGREVGYANQKAEILSIIAGAFGWRAIARELAGKIPLGGGLIPKGAIAWAGTFVIGKGLEHFNHANSMPTPAQRKELYEQAFEEGKDVAAGLRRELPE
jgi:hypothetical protein